MPLDNEEIEEFDIPTVPYQQRLLECTTRLISGPAGLGSGKSSGAALWIVDRALDNSMGKGAPTLSLFAEPTSPMLKAVALLEIGKVLEYQYGIEHGHGWQWHGDKSDYYISIRFDPAYREHRIYLRAAASNTSTDGLNCGSVVVDEAGNRKYNLDRAFDRFRVRANRDARCPMRQFLATGTPEGTTGAFYDYSVKEKHKPGVFTLIRGISDENIFLPPSYVDDSLAHLTPDEAAQYRLGEFISRGGKCYHRFSADRHIKNIDFNPMIEGKLVMGVDFGVRRSAWVLGVLVTDFYDLSRPKLLHILAEVTGNREDTDAVFHKVKAAWMRIAERFSRISRKWEEIAPTITAFCDASAHHASDRNVLAKQGLKIVCDGRNPLVMDRLYSVNDALKTNKMLIDENAPQVITALADHEYDDKTGAPAEDKNDIGKGDCPPDHINDATGYIIWHTWPVLAPRGNQVIYHQHA